MSAIDDEAVKQVYGRSTERAMRHRLISNLVTTATLETNTHRDTVARSSPRSSGSSPFAFLFLLAEISSFARPAAPFFLLSSTAASISSATSPGSSSNLYASPPSASAAGPVQRGMDEVDACADAIA